MQFSELLAEAGLAGAQKNGDAEVKRVVVDSRQAQGGDVFVAVRGAATDGHQYIASAAAGGCSAIVCEDASAVPGGVPVAVVPNARVGSALLAQAIRGWPCRKLILAGVTGTKGKTTYTYLLRHILQSAGHKVALVGTIAYQAGGKTVEASNTTPGAVELAEIMARAVADGATHLVMEVSSHALDQQRVAGLDFAVGAFTNLTGDHIDYHKTTDNYRSAKRLLFEGLGRTAWAVINRDDPSADAMAGAAAGRVLFYGLSEQAELQGRIRELGATGTSFTLCYAGESLDARVPLVGKYNVYNCLCAAGSALALGVTPQAVVAALATAGQVPGRLQRVPTRAPFEVLVDYAHTDDALLQVLSALKPLTRGKLICVFGCGGDRDNTKRPRMAKVAEQWADAVIVTSDNPRTEDPDAIIAQVVAGFTPAGRSKATILPDRREAIARAIAQAGSGDVVLIAGKGHENYQIIGKTKRHFDDVETAGECLRGRNEGVSLDRLGTLSEVEVPPSPPEGKMPSLRAGETPATRELP